MKKIKNRAITKYCTGCGLCKAFNKAKLSTNEKGFYVPESGDEEFLKKVCPSVAKCQNSIDSKKIWGKCENVYFGWSNNQEIRSKASSGGIITTIALYLLENHIVDYIIQVGADETDPTKTNVYFSDTKEQVISRAGSRYCISHSLEKINEIDYTKKYAFIGRPCDITALKNYSKINNDIKDSIIYYFSFFCMGTPSDIVQKKLLMEMNCINCKSLTYRGNGWPGLTTAISDDGKVSEMKYIESWGNILGRDLMPLCRFCIDGIGEEADISCGDAWYIKDNIPDFSEHEGRNIIFSRSKNGSILLEKLINDKIISVENCDDYTSYLKIIQKSQYERRKNLFARITALKTFGKASPKYSIDMMKYYAKDSSIVDWTKTYFGTIKRIIKKNI